MPTSTFGKQCRVFICSISLVLILTALQADPGRADEYFAFIAKNDQTVSKINVETGQIEQTIAVGTGSHAVAGDPTGRYVYVANIGGGSFSRINFASGVVDKTINIVGQSQYAAFSPDGSTVYASNSSADKIYRIDAASGNIIATIDAGDQPMNAVVNPSNGYVYVTNWIDQSVSLIDPSSNSVIKTINVGAGPRGVTVSPNGANVYVANQLAGTVSRINVATEAVDKTIAVGAGPIDLDIGPDGRYIYVSNRDDDTVSRINAASAAVDKTIAVGDNPQGISVTPDGRFVFAANLDDNTVSRIDVASAAVDKTIVVTGGPTSYGRFILTIPTETTPDRQPGGPAGLLGGGGNNPPPLNPAGQVTIIDPAVGEAIGQSGLVQTRMVPLAGPGEGGSTASNFSISSANPTPGLMYRLTDPTGAATESWLPLAGSGYLPNGVHWTGATRYNYDVRVVDLTFDWPAGFIGRMAPGRWTVEYWFQTESGLCSNKRWEFLDVVSGSSTDDRGPAATGELTFNLMLSVFSSATNQVAKVTDGLVKTVIDDETYDSWLITDGAATIRLPFGQDCQLCFLSDEFVGQRNLDCRFENGLLRITEADHNNEPVAYYEDPYGDGYCLEYYRDRLYVCNPGDQDGPVMGLLYGE